VILGEVTGNVVATEKNPHYKGRKVLIVQPVTPEGAPAGKPLVAVDAVQAGIGDRVLVVDEGGSARASIQDETAVTIRTVVCAIVDEVQPAEGTAT
jgi:ethanolamine utilization protein EutN